MFKGKFVDVKTQCFFYKRQSWINLAFHFKELGGIKDQTKLKTNTREVIKSEVETNEIEIRKILTAPKISSL